MLSVFTLFLLAPAALSFWIKERLDDGLNQRPVIGILTVPHILPDISSDDVIGTLVNDRSKSYIAGTYEKFATGGGVRTVPVPYHLPWDELTDLLSHINGVLIPGGFEEFYVIKDGKRVPDLWLTAVINIMKYAEGENDAGRYYPIWGTCLGLQAMHYAVDINIDMADVDSGYLPNQIKFTEKARTSKLYSLVDDLDWFETLTNYHNFNFGILPEHYVKHPKLAEYWNILALTEDRNGTAIVSIIEAKNYPFYSVMFHPERTLYCWMEAFGTPHD
jgi:gamma-glutamyl hydrolase